MNAKKHSTMTVLAIAGFLIVGLVILNGCGKDEPAPNPAQNSHDHDGHDHSNAEMAMATETAMEVAEIEQTTCPVMEGNPINKALFTEYKGKKVYFCCAGCDAKFKADPEKYIAKLPQFK